MAVLWSGVLSRYGVGWKCRRIGPIGKDGDDPSQLWRMVSIGVLLSVRERLRKHSLRCCGVGWDVGGSSQSERIETTRHSGDGWCRFAPVRQSARDLENIFIAVLWSGVKMSADRDDPSQRWLMVSIRVRSSVRERLWKYSWFVLFILMEFVIGSKLTGVGSHAWSSKSSLTVAD